MLVLEFLPGQPPLASRDDMDRLQRNLVPALAKPKSIDELLTLSAHLGRMISGYDRVMVYKFHEDLHGQVIAESTDHPDRFLGLHYPASDIPEPARRHFLLNTIRVIADVEHVPSEILPAYHPVRDEPLDLSFSRLRAVSPTHIRYLRNMGVRASMSISLIVNGELWGLIACHHYRARHLSAIELHLCELFGTVLATFIQSVEHSERFHKIRSAQELAVTFEVGMYAGLDLTRLVEAQASSMLKLVDADGLAFSCDGSVFRAGSMPDRLPPFEALAQQAREGVWITSRLSDVLDLSPQQIELCAGGALLTLSEDGRDFLFLGRGEYAHTVEWAGDPGKNITEVKGENDELSPRRSFALWRQDVSNASRPFDSGDRDTTHILRRVLFALRSAGRERQALAAKADAEAERARLKVELFETARKNSMSELASVMAHELSQPLTALTNYVNAVRQELRQLPQALPRDIERLMDEAVSEATRAGTLVRRLRSFVEQGDLERALVDINQLLADTVRLALSATSATDVSLEMVLAPGMPAIWADRVQIEQVVFNLVRNAVEAMVRSDPKMIVVTSQTRQNQVEVRLSDTGPGIPAEFAEVVFDPFRSTKGSGMGIGLSLCRSIIHAHGGHMDVGNTAQGAEIGFTLPIGHLEAWDE